MILALNLDLSKIKCTILKPNEQGRKYLLVRPLVPN